MDLCWLYCFELLFAALLVCIVQVVCLFLVSAGFGFIYHGGLGFLGLIVC